MRKVPNLSISPEKAFFIVAKARQSDSKAAESDLVTDLSDDDGVYGVEDHSKGTDRSELSGFIRGLNVDEQIDLVALMWLGRGDGDLDGWSDLRAEAARAQTLEVSRVDRDSALPRLGVLLDRRVSVNFAPRIMTRER
jgi:hypothetical protein